MAYIDMDYRALKTECAKRGLGGAGKKDELINKLVAADNDMQQEPPPPPKKKQPKLKPTDFNPDNPNYDMAGRWIRRQGNIRPDGAICEGGWSDDCVIGHT